MFVFEDDGVGCCVEAAEGHSDVFTYFFSSQIVSADFAVVSDRVEGL
jgi:hypothetical protein